MVLLGYMLHEAYECARFDRRKSCYGQKESSHCVSFISLDGGQIVDVQVEEAGMITRGQAYFVAVFRLRDRRCLFTSPNSQVTIHAQIFLFVMRPVSVVKLFCSRSLPAFPSYDIFLHKHMFY